MDKRHPVGFAGVPSGDNPVTVEPNRAVGTDTPGAAAGLGTRQRFDEVIVREWQRCARNGTLLSLILMEIDSFPAYAAHYGAPAGIVCIDRLARAVSAGIHRAADFVARYGAQHFATILPRTDLEGVHLVAERIRRNVGLAAIPHAGDAATPVVTLSFGLATCGPRNEAGPEEIVTVAEAMLLKARRAGGNRIESRFFSV